jgi:hypothetical protein
VCFGGWGVLVEYFGAVCWWRMLVPCVGGGLQVRMIKEQRQAYRDFNWNGIPDSTTLYRRVLIWFVEARDILQMRLEHLLDSLGPE